MNQKISPFEHAKDLVHLHANALEKFKRIRAGIDDPDYRELMPCVGKDVEGTDESFDVTLAGITLRCTLKVDPTKRRGVVEFAHVRREDVRRPVELGEVSFNIRNGSTELRHFTEYTDDNQGDQLDLTNPFGMREVLATYFLKAAEAKV